MGIVINLQIKVMSTTFVVSVLQNVTIANIIHEPEPLFTISGYLINFKLHVLCMQYQQVEVSKYKTLQNFNIII